MVLCVIFMSLFLYFIFFWNKIEYETLLKFIITFNYHHYILIRYILSCHKTHKIINEIKWNVNSSSFIRWKKMKKRRKYGVKTTGWLRYLIPISTPMRYLLTRQLRATKIYLKIEFFIDFNYLWRISELTKNLFPMPPIRHK